MMKHIKRHTISFKNAFSGVKWALSTQPNYKIHAFLSAVTIIFGVYFAISETEWLIIITLITGGFTVETLNTAVEATTDAIDIKWRHDIKIAKDLAAAAMLFYAIGAVVAASII